MFFGEFFVGKMLRLVVLLLLCVAVRGKEMKCDLVKNIKYCWNSTTHQEDSCLICDIRNQQISKFEEVIFLNHPDNVDAVKFTGGNITKMPNLIQKSNNKEILAVQLYDTKSRVMNLQFFGNAGENLTKIVCIENDNLLVEAFAFQNCKNLEQLDISYNIDSIIEPDAFRGLHKLVWLRLNANGLSLMPNGWFQDLANLEELRLYDNKLTEIPDNAFKSLTKLQKLELFKNKIEVITRNMFKHNKQLQRINLRGNRISQIQSGSFAHLSQLTQLNLLLNKCVRNEFLNKTPDEIAKGLTACYPASTCVIPQIPNGSIVSIDDNSTQLPGELFEGSVKVVCDSTFTQIHDKANQTTNRCVKGNWEDQQWPTCHSE